MLIQLNANILNKDQKLSELRSNKDNLEQILQLVQQRIKRSQPSNTRFEKLKGQLLWPTKGQIIYQFGKPIQHSQLTWSGDIIRAPEGQNVYVIAPGRVSYAGWLRGFGLLLIISHDHGYMSLYARNHSLYKKVGETVKAGDLIASVGRSGGYQSSGLYFELRHNGNPINPRRWIARS